MNDRDVSKNTLPNADKDPETYPYTYQAVINILGGGKDELQVSYFADTICGLVNHLKKHREDPGSAKLFEIYRGRETLIPSWCYIGKDGKWMTRRELCFPMTTRYGEPGREGSCPFRFRSHIVT